MKQNCENDTNSDLLICDSFIEVLLNDSDTMLLCNMFLKVTLKISDNNIIMFLSKTCGDSHFGSEQWVIYNQTHMIDSVGLKQLKWKELLILD